MARNQKEVEDALFQIKNLEESLQRNAQGILSSTMKEEISSLVKESLKEQDEVEDEDEEEVDVDIEDTDADNEEGVDDEEYDMDYMDDEETIGQTTIPSDDDTIDLTQASDTEVLRVFRAMGDNDGVVVKKDNNMIHLSDNENDAEYIIQLAESMMDDSELKEFGKSEFDLYSRHFGDDEEDDFEDEDYGLGMPDDMPAYKTKYRYSDEEEDEFGDEFEDERYPGQKDALDYEERAMNRYFSKDRDDDGAFEDEHDYDDEFWDNESLSEENETIYEIELDDLDNLGLGHKKSSKFSFAENEDLYGEFMETEMMTSPIEGEAQNSQTQKMPTPMQESKGRFKAKGTGMGNASKFKYDKKPNMGGGFKTVKRNANKTMGTGKAKFEYKEEVNDEGFGKKVDSKKMETKEAARTYGNGSKSGRGLRKGITPNRNLTLENERELDMLRNKNDEYRKALDLFRTKLNEVAVFNSNLAYATRLFTEHSTTKQEKINILRRFDNVETLKESKGLYKSIKSELGSEKPNENTITESFQRNVEKTPSNGSAVNLIESKTYENPQFLRMKDLMTKIK
jgi:hypothetical protein